MLSNAATRLSISTTLLGVPLSESAVPYYACRRTRPWFVQVTSGQRSHTRLTKEETKDIAAHKAHLDPVPLACVCLMGTMVTSVEDQSEILYAMRDKSIQPQRFAASALDGSIGPFQ